MVKINILLENHSIDKKYFSSHGLSVLMEFNEKLILLDVGPNNDYLKNANKKNIDLSKVNYLFLSHNHNDHTGGINSFLKLNSSAAVYLMDNILNKYYINMLFFKSPISLKIKKKYIPRITQVKEDLNIENKIFFLKNESSKYRKPTFNSELFKKEESKYINDTFDHEGIFVLEDNNELLVFNSCSHNGILNSIETVKAKLPNKKIKAYLGGLHLSNPVTKDNESDEYLDYLAKELKGMETAIYTGHCTGEYSLNYLKNGLGDKVKEINTGMELSF